MEVRYSKGASMLDRILVPLDGSREAEGVFPILRRLLMRRDAEVILFQAIHPPLTIQTSHAATALAAIEGEAATYLATWKAKLESEGARVRTHTAAERPADAILQAAREVDASIIAMSTHGRSGLERWMMGSVTEDVLR